MMNLKKLLSLLLSAVVLVSVVGCKNVAVKPEAGVGLTFDLSWNGKVIENKFSELLVHNEFLSQTAENEPNDYFSSQYPFVKRVEIINATGGTASKDLFIDPTDRSTLTDYKFDTLIYTCKNIVDKGLKPFIVTGNVPLKFCSDPLIGDEFNQNVRPPDDYNQYYTYIKAIATALVKQFGLNEVRSWSWGVLTEYENKDWFCAADYSPETTKIAYFKLYDYTVAALQDVVGAKNLVVGAHGMVISPGFWDESEFIDHCAFGKNYKTGAKGTQINFLTTSFYDRKPGELSEMTFDDCINQLRNRAVADGLTNLKFGADEGRILEGQDGIPLTTRDVAMSYQGAADARLFKDMIDNNIDWFAARALNTGTIWGGIDLVGTHVANLGYKMTGDTYLDPKIAGTSKNVDDQINGIGGFNGSKKTAHIMLYNFNKDPAAIDSEPTTVTIKNVGMINKKKVTVKQWIVDDTHGNFWPTWWNDRNARNIDYSEAKWSEYSATVPSQLKSWDDKYFWYGNVETYTELSKLKSTSKEVTVTNGTITLTETLTHHAVVFYEITEK